MAQAYPGSCLRGTSQAPHPLFLISFLLLPFLFICFSFPIPPKEIQLDPAQTAFLLLLLQELVEDVAVATSSRHADLSWARRFAVASPRFIGRRSASKRTLRILNSHKAFIYSNIFSRLCAVQMTVECALEVGDLTRFLCSSNPGFLGSLHRVSADYVYGMRFKIFILPPNSSTTGNSIRNFAFWKKFLTWKIFSGLACNHCHYTSNSIELTIPPISQTCRWNSDALWCSFRNTCFRGFGNYFPLSVTIKPFMDNFCSTSP